MTIMSRVFVAVCATLGVAACHTPQTAVQQERSTSLSSAALIGNWRLINLNGIALQQDVASLNLQPNGRFVATVYCNYAKGIYKVEGRSISFDGWDATERGCNEEMPALDRIEDALRGDGYAINFDNGDLLLTGPARLRLRRF